MAVASIVVPALSFTGLVGTITGIGNAIFKRDGTEEAARAAIFSLATHVAGSPESWFSQSGLQVHASPDADNATAVFNHANWTVGDVVGTLEGFSMEALSNMTNGMMSGNFSFSLTGNASEPVTGQWIVVDETANATKLAGFKHLTDMLASEKHRHETTLEELLDAVVKEYEVANVTHD